VKTFPTPIGVTVRADRHVRSALVQSSRQGKRLRRSHSAGAVRHGGEKEDNMPRSSRIATGFWTFTTLFCLQMGFTAYGQLRLSQVAESFQHLGFPDYFRVELAVAKLLGVMLLVVPVPPRIKEWAYAGFAITLGSALIAHLSVGDGPAAWGWAAGTGVLWGLSYYFWRRLQVPGGRAVSGLPALTLAEGHGSRA
jgi:hypothetical protein